MNWIRVTPCDNIPPREGRAVSIAGHDIAIFNLGDQFVAVANSCPHKAGPLADGIVTGTSVVCPLHTWKISLVSGQVERPSAGAKGVATYPARVESGVVVVGVPVIIQDCLSMEPLLHERSLDPPCPDAGRCVSSMPERPGPSGGRLSV